ncbi:hypothetical protein C5F61_09290 [Photobacterium damselae subsp. damselae]|nr:hypothetical protein C5F61_09290 [Photobacterium damselae subsp. damselae]
MAKCGYLQQFCRHSSLGWRFFMLLKANLLKNGILHFLVVEKTITLILFILLFLKVFLSLSFC